MKLLNIGEIEVVLKGNQAFIYSEDKSDVLNMQNVENNPNAEEEIRLELEFRNRSSDDGISSLI